MWNRDGFLLAAVDFYAGASMREQDYMRVTDLTCIRMARVAIKGVITPEVEEEIATARLALRNAELILEALPQKRTLQKSAATTETCTTIG